MKRKTRNKIIKIIVLLLIMIGIFFLGRQSGLTIDVSNTTTNVTEETVSKRTIQKTLTSSGQIETATIEKLVPSTSKYFKTMCVEDDDMIEVGENILEYSDGTYLVAPYNCVIVSHSLADTGNKCTSSHYVEIQSLDNLITTISINENEINEVAEGQEVKIIPTADTSKTYTGTITKIDSIGTYQASGTTFTATVSFTNDGALKIGMSVSCSILLKEAKDVITVPINAVQTNHDTKYVVVANEDGTTQNVDIETGISDDEYVEVITGLEEGQKVKVTTTTTQNITRSTSSKESQRGMGGEQTGGRSEMMQPDGSQDTGRQNAGQGMGAGEMPKQ